MEARTFSFVRSIARSLAGKADCKAVRSATVFIFCIVGDIVPKSRLFSREGWVGRSEDSAVLETRRQNETV